MNVIQIWNKMNQKKAMMNDLWNKDERIKWLERELTEALEILNKTQKKLNVAIEGLIHIKSEGNYIIAEKCLDEIYEA